MVFKLLKGLVGGKRFLNGLGIVAEISSVLTVPSAIGFVARNDLGTKSRLRLTGMS